MKYDNVVLQNNGSFSLIAICSYHAIHASKCHCHIQVLRLSVESRSYKVLKMFDENVLVSCWSVVQISSVS